MNRRLTKRNDDFSIITKEGVDVHYISQALSKLQQYENMEEDGMLLKLPCKIGDPIYEICELNTYGGADVRCLGKERKIEKWEFDLSMCGIIDKIGDTWFLTESEAIKRFKELYGEFAEEGSIVDDVIKKGDIMSKKHNDFDVMYDEQYWTTDENGVLESIICLVDGKKIDMNVVWDENGAYVMNGDEKIYVLITNE